MSTIRKSPNYIHPEKPNAVGSRNSSNRDGRNEYIESKGIVNEEVDKILNHLNSKLPPEVLNKLHISSTIKELLHTYFNQSMQNMLNRYLTTIEDEMAKKFRDFVDDEERTALNQHNVLGIPKLLDEVGGQDKFHLSEIERSVVNMYGHLQGHVQRGQVDLEQITNDLLRHRSGVGSFIRGENVNSILKCAFVDCIEKPENVLDISVSINILKDELISPIYHYLVSPAEILGLLISDIIVTYLNKEIEQIDNSLLDQGRETLTYNEKVFEKIKTAEKFISDEPYNPNDKQLRNKENIDRVQLVKKMINIVKGIPVNVSKMTSDPIAFSENIAALLNDETIRNRGFNTASNILTAVLDTSKMGYQYIENNKNARHLTIREYEDSENLPDESYEINLIYLDAQQLQEIRITYLQQFDDLEFESQKIYDICVKIYENVKDNQNIVDYKTVKDNFLKNEEKPSLLGGIFKLLGVNSNKNEEEEDDKIWDEITFIEPSPTHVENANASFRGKQNRINALLVASINKLETTFGRKYPIERICVEDRIAEIKSLFYDFLKKYNPFHVQPGLNFQMILKTIKRKQTTSKTMSNVINEFLSGVSLNFQDTAFADFKRRRSTDHTETYERFKNFEKM